MMRTENRRVYDANSDLVSVKEQIFQAFAWGTEMIAEIVDPIGESLDPNGQP